MDDMPSIRALYTLLAQASTLPCSTGAQAILSLFTSENDRLALALDGLIPALHNESLGIPERVLAAYVLHALYVSHDHPDPFHDHLLRAFNSERAAVITRAKSLSITGLSGRVLGLPNDDGGMMHADSEQLVWVLGKILKGEGGDLAPYSPNILSSRTSSDHLRTAHQILQQEGNAIQPNNMYSPTMELSHTSPQKVNPVTPRNNATQRHSLHDSQLSYSSSPVLERTPSNTAFPCSYRNISPNSRDLNHQSASRRQNSETYGRSRTVVPTEVPREEYQLTSNWPADPYRRIVSPSLLGSVHSEVGFDPTNKTLPSSQDGLYSMVTEDQRRQALLRALCEEPHALNGNADLLNPRRGMYESGEPLGISRSGVSKEPIPEQRWALQESQSQPFALSPPHAPLSEYPVSHKFVQDFFGHPNPAPENSPISNPDTVGIRSPFGTIPRVRPTSLSGYPEPYTPAEALEPAFTNGSAPIEAVQFNGGNARDMGVQVDKLLQWPPSSPFTQELLTPSRVPQPTRSPGVIGSGRPSVPALQNNAPANKSPAVERRSQVGVIGNGRPGPSAVAKDKSQVLGAQNPAEVFRGMIPFSALRTEKVGKYEGQLDFGVIGPPKNGPNGSREQSLDGIADGPEERPRPTSVDSVSLDLEQHALVEVPSEGKASKAVLNQHIDHLNPPRDLGLLPPRTSSEPRASSPLTRSIPASTAATEDETPSIPPQLPCASVSASSALEYGWLRRTSETSRFSPVGGSPPDKASKSQVQEQARIELSRAILLLLNARERVLTLSEQRVLQPHLQMLVQPLSILQPNDLSSLVAKNPDIAAKLFILLLDRKDEEMAQVERVLRDVSESKSFGSDRGSAVSPSPASLDSTGAVGAIQTVVEYVSTHGGLSAAPSDSLDTSKVSPFGGREARQSYLDALKKLPPTMQSFNVIARLLRPTHHGSMPTEQEDSPEVRVASLIRTEVLGGFVTGCVRWIEQTEQEEKEGEVHDDRVAVAVSSLCRFYSSLLKHGFVSPASEEDTTEIMSFALHFSRFEEARSLYSTLAATRA